MAQQKKVRQKHTISPILAPLRKFFFAHGHVHVPNLPEYETLFALCNQLRMSRSRLDHTVREDLDEMGFLWDLHLSNELRWHYRYAQLKDFYEQFGHTRVPAKVEEFKALGVWVQRQRKNEKNLPTKSKNMLDALCFEWRGDIKERKNQQWKLMFQRLKSFYKKHGHANVSDSYKLDEQLGRWVSTVRSREDYLEDWQKKLLKTVRFKFHEDIQQEKDAKRRTLFRNLESFYKKYGHVNVPETYADSKLALSVAYFRQHPERITPTEKRQLKLWGFLFREEIKKRWKQLWEKSFGKLERFKAEYGHCRVSSVYKDQPLARWVSTQRMDKRDSKLPSQREKKLRSIGFSFHDDIAALQEKKWMGMYNKLLRFKKIHGTPMVPESHKDKSLVYWVLNQRQAKKRMNTTRKKLLNRIKFVWVAR